MPGGARDATLCDVSRKLIVLALLGAAFAVLVVYSGPVGKRIAPFPAPAFAGDAGVWLNSPPVQLGAGRVALVELWSYG